MREIYTGIVAKGFTTENNEEKLAANKARALIKTVEKGIISLKNSSIVSDKIQTF
jgi:hypothetical protein